MNWREWPSSCLIYCGLSGLQPWGYNSVDGLQFVLDNLPSVMAIVWIPSILIWIIYSQIWQSCGSPLVCSGSLTHRYDKGVYPSSLSCPTDITMVWMPSSLFWMASCMMWIHSGLIWITYPQILQCCGHLQFGLDHLPSDMTIVWIHSSLFWITYPQIWQWCGSPPVCTGTSTHRYDDGVDPFQFVLDHLPTDMIMMWIPSSMYWITYPQIWQWCGCPPVCSG